VFGDTIRPDNRSIEFAPYQSLGLAAGALMIGCHGNSGTLYQLGVQHRAWIASRHTDDTEVAQWFAVPYLNVSQPPPTNKPDIRVLDWSMRY